MNASFYKGNAFVLKITDSGVQECYRGGEGRCQRQGFANQKNLVKFAI